MYKLKDFILSVTNIVSLLDFNNTGLSGPTVRGPAWPVFFYQNSGPALPAGRPDRPWLYYVSLIVLMI